MIAYASCVLKYVHHYRDKVLNKEEKIVLERL